MLEKYLKTLNVSKYCITINGESDKIWKGFLGVIEQCRKMGEADGVQCMLSPLLQAVSFVGGRPLDKIWFHIPKFHSSLIIPASEIRNISERWDNNQSKEVNHVKWKWEVPRKLRKIFSV